MPNKRKPRKLVEVIAERPNPAYPGGIERSGFYTRTPKRMAAHLAANGWTLIAEGDAMRNNETTEDRYEDGPTMVEAIALAGTQTNRCLGCAAPVDAAPGYGRCQQCHGPYGTGVRVDYARWLALVERISNDGAIFDCWAAGEPRFRIPSYFSPTELAELLGEAAWRLELPGGGPMSADGWACEAFVTTANGYTLCLDHAAEWAAGGNDVATRPATADEAEFGCADCNDE